MFKNKFQINISCNLVIIVLFSLSLSSCSVYRSLFSKKSVTELDNSVDTVKIEPATPLPDTVLPRRMFVDDALPPIDSLIVIKKEPIIKPDTIAVEKDSIIEAIQLDTTSIVQLLDFSEDQNGLQLFKEALKSVDSEKVRVAIVGDSFIEGDFFSADVREMLQGEYGGDGVGFVSTTSVASTFRSTIRHTHGDWNSYSIRKKYTDSPLASKFLISAIVSTPKVASPVVSYSTTDKKEHLKDVKSVKYIFRSEKESSIETTVNGSITKKFTTKASPSLQTIEVVAADGDTINKIDIRHNNISNFYSYGANFDGGAGIYVDNFSDRGTAGTVLARMSPSHNISFNKINNYSLIVLQFGLNILSNKQNDYKYFENSMVSVVEKVKEYYPEASIIVLGVSDRNIKVDGKYVAIPQTKSFIENQKNIARRTGVLFWDTYEAMQQEGGIKSFVANKWAAGDHTHVNGAGAKIVAEKFVEALRYKLRQQE